MDKRKFDNGEKVMYQGCVYTVEDARYTYYPTGSWWEYYLFDGNKTILVAEKSIEGTTILPAQEKPVSVAKNGKKRKNKR